MLGLFVAALGATYLVSLRIPSTFLPVEDQGYFFVVIQLPDGASLQRTDAVAKQVREILRHARRRHRRLDQRPQLPHQCGAVELGGGVRHPQAVGRAPARAERLEHRGLGAPEAAPDPGRLRAELRSAVDPRPRRHRRLRVPGRGPDRPRQHGAQRGDAGGDRRGAQAAGDQPAAAVLARSAPRRRSSTTTSTAPRRSCSASTCRTCSTRCRSISARSTSTTSTCSAAPSG